MKPKIPPKSKSSGFSLIVTVCMLILLSIIAIGLLSLSTVSLRQGGILQGQLEARANAKLALMMALGELQETAGLDTRITASAEATHGLNGSRQLTGVWRSWEGADRDSSNGFPLAPPYADKLKAGDRKEAEDAGRFLTWLVSGKTNGSTINSPPSLLAGAGTVPLVSSGTLGRGKGSQPLAVHLTPSTIEDGGKFAWWVQGENSKALLKQPKKEPSDAEEWSERLASHGQADVTNFGLNTDSGLEKAVSLKTLDISSSLQPDLTQQNFHDITAYSRGLLTNASNGGWKRDLSLMSENWNDLPSSELPFHTLEPGKENSVSKTRSGNRGRRSQVGQLFYPWAAQGPVSAEVNSSFFVPCATASWGALVKFTQQYRNFSGQFQGAPLLPMKTTRWDYEARDEVKAFPLAARIHYVISMGATSTGRQYTPCIVMDPVVTLWNPYNVALNVTQNSTRISTYAPTPLSFQVEINDPSGSGNENFKTDLKKLISGGKTVFYNLDLGGASGTRWAPGEVRVYSDKQTARVTTNIELSAGYRTTGGFMFPLYKNGTTQKTEANKIKLSGNATFTISRIATDAIARTYQGKGLIGSRHEFKDPVQGWGYRFTTLLDSSSKSDYWGDEVTLEPPPQEASLSSLSGQNQPFVTAIYGLRTAVDMLGNPNFHTSPALFEMNPLNAHYAMSSADTSDPRLETYPYEWTFKTISDRADNNAPSGIPGDEEGYLGTSFRSNEGFSKLVINELPVRPIQSLGELQHFNVTAPSMAPPFTFNPIGNSSASPSIASNLVSAEGSAPTNMSYDHSYICNQLLFDDWFVSSIAPQKNSYPTGAINEDVTGIYTDHLTGKVPLPNSAYLPLRFYNAEGAATAAEILEEDDSWKNIAAELEVEGMFNVNSTSVAAWMALFLHLKDAAVPTLDQGSMTLEQGKGTVVSRNLIPNSSQTTSTLSHASELKSFARFTDGEIAQLAQHVVDEIKLRGPFLSLSEFLNRQLSNGDQALSGALEAALMKLTSEGATSHLGKLNQSFGEEGKLANITDTYEFPSAANVSKAYGFPGWIRQADLLRPLAPILTVRDDTFIIRTYGESSSGKETAWCEAVVQRVADYLDSRDDKTTLPSEATLDSEINQLFGRKFQLVSFRWLHKNEV